MKSRSSRPNPAASPWTLARLLATDLLAGSPDTLNRVLGKIRARDLKYVAELGQIEDIEYQSSDFGEVSSLRQIGALFKKNASFSDPKRCEEAAIANFHAGEEKCLITNVRLEMQGPLEERFSSVPLYLERMRRDISAMLGDAEVAPDVLDIGLRMTSGATEDRTRRRSYPFLKITGNLRAPLTAVPHIGRTLQKFGVPFEDVRFTAVEHNAVVFVPKNWKTHRSIAKEPTHALPFQLALDKFLKQRLKRCWGIDLSTQAVNQNLAREGSIDGSLATIDLSQASDTLSLNAVATLLPDTWFMLFKAFRSRSWRSKFGRGHYHKFSSMGNGYTFTLETLIFAAACRAVGAKRFSVYGDDIILETELAGNLVKLLNYLGFGVNEEKSFMNPSSRFRESCGCDYFKGQLVTPFYMREWPKVNDHPSTAHLINGLVAASPIGALWGHLAALRRQMSLRLVPWNDDTRSGVFITPRQCWDMGKLYIDRRPTLRGQTNPLSGFPVFKGYGQVHTRRVTPGWRSLLLWFLQVGRTDDDPKPTSRKSDILLKRVGDGDTASNVTSEVVVRTRFTFMVRRYSPALSSTPDHLFLWDEVVGG